MAVHLLCIADGNQHQLWVSSVPVEAENFDQESMMVFSSVDPIQTSVQRNILINILQAGGVKDISYD